MSDITPSDTQARAIATIKDWFQNETGKKQVFRLFGYAGTGKSTVLKFALAELGLEPHRGDRTAANARPASSPRRSPARPRSCFAARARRPAPSIA